jgi:pyruvate/2-oxoglutarate/acetoin dehydrogenase E1 component/TPP-dependent pyruvate/acetoin dehydrogenase alpha subunit
MNENSKSKDMVKDAADYKSEVLNDYRIVNESRQASLMGRREVLNGKGKFGIFGDGKEVAQIAMAKVFQNGDFRSGYYRDQTFAFASGISDLKKFFAQLYADTDIEKEPCSGGRSMNCHYATRSLDENGRWKNLMEMKNSSADISPTAGQMQRLLGLAYASKLYRSNPALSYLDNFSVNGNEVAFGTIGNASSAEGIFFEAINAAGVLMVPMAVSIWDDGFGISVPNVFQITKSSISDALSGFEYKEETGQGFLIYRVNGWNYEELVKTYHDGIAIVREKHIPAIFHITEMTQPQGHSTSGSHERYKTKERLLWEKDFDCIRQMRLWILKKGIAVEKELNDIEAKAKETVIKIKLESWDEFVTPIRKERNDVVEMIREIENASSEKEKLTQIAESLYKILDQERKVIGQAINDALIHSRNEKNDARKKLEVYYDRFIEENYIRYSSYFHSESDENALLVKEIKPVYSESSPLVDGREILLAFFDKAFEREPRLFAIGEDIGQLGDVNQGLAGLQAKYGDLRVTDTGIRETTIMGQGIGAALRGLKPIVEIQYLDYVFYALQVLSDDLACLHYRTKGGQKAPVIIRTRGHRLEGIWHSGSPLGTLINAFRGIYICVPRNMTQAAGFYNTLLKSDEPGLIIERLNAYRLKEKMPDNIGDITIPLGVPEILNEGDDVTVVTYGACVDITKAAITKLEEVGISVELIDVQTLLPFDSDYIIVESLKKTNRVLFLDEDVPGGASAYMMQQVIEEQDGYKYLDSKPVTLAAKPHRPPYGTDGDYFSKPNTEDVFRTIYEMMHESDPEKYPDLYK